MVGLPRASTAVMTPDSATCSIRLAIGADAQPIAEMARDLIETGLGWSWTRDRVLRSCRHPDTNAIVAVRDGARVGFAIMKYGEEDAHLLLLAVQPVEARRGVGRGLVGWLEQSARIAGIGRITLEARVRNTAARSFYLRLGYRAKEVLPGYYGGREASVRMVKDLRSGGGSDPTPKLRRE